MDKELKAQKKTLKKAYKTARRKSHGLWKFFTWFSAPIAIVMIMGMVVLSTFDNTVALFVGGTFWKLENEDPEAIYYENKKTPKHFFDVLFGNRYDDEDMIILRERDFMHY